MYRAIQKIIRLSPKRRGVYLIDQQIATALPELERCRIGTLHLFLQHTSAALTLNENYDPDVRMDLESFLARLIPDGAPYFRHRLEGDDDMPAHLVSMLLGRDVTVPVTDGRPRTGTWQGLYLVEWKYRASGRNIVATLQGDFVEE